MTGLHADSRRVEPGSVEHAHTMAAADVLTALGVDPAAGLSRAEAALRLETFGPNSVEAADRRTILSIVAGQLSDFMILVLLAAAVVSGLIGTVQDTIVIIVIVLLNAAIGAAQELRAQTALESLRKMAAPMARVVRDGKPATVPSAAIVPGDIVLLEAGNVVPADLRLADTTDLQIDESALTGESLSVAKGTSVLDNTNLTLGDRVNMAYKDSLVTRGKCVGICVATGTATETGKIARLLKESTRQRTPLQERVARFGRQLSFVILALCALIFAIGLMVGEPPLLMLLTAVSLAVAAVPEALPAVVTIGLALGAHRLAKDRALVRRLPAVEALGSVSYICADKTGTLTENRMTLDRVYAGGRHFGSLLELDRRSLLYEHIGRALILNSDVRQIDDRFDGDPTELALFMAAHRAGASIEARNEYPRLGELAFNEKRKRMTTLHRLRDGYIAYTKGAPEAVLPLCTRTMDPDGEAAASLDRARQEAANLAARGYRVIAIAMRRLEDFDADTGADADIESGMCFLALAGLLDPPRPEVPNAVAECHSAGIVPVMITGDHPQTARHIATRLGIMEPDGSVMTGESLAKLTEPEFAKLARDVRVYARVDPAQKIRIVDTLSSTGEYVAMTGDGVNDAPALTRAAIGVAMGKRGTDVAREAADMVLLDDNFATIIGAVEDGRRIFDNIRKFIKYAMTSNSGEIWTLLIAPLIGLPVPLLPIHILWINLLTDGLPGLAFVAEKAERDIMSRKPRPPQESLISRGMWHYMLWYGLLIGGLSIGGQFWFYSEGIEYWQTVTFTVLVVAQLFNALAIRSEHDSLFKIGPLSNKFMIWAIVVTVGLQLAVVYTPAMNSIFHTQPLPLADLAVCFGLGAVVLAASEAQKLLRLMRR